MSSATVALFLVSTAMGQPPPGMVVGSVSQPLTAADGSSYLIYLPPNWTPTGSHPVLLFLHGIGGINNGAGCRNPGLTTQFRLLEPAYAAKVNHIVLVPVAAKEDWIHHLPSSLALVDMAVSALGGDPSRVAVAGQAMGGHGALSYARLRPDRFCAAVLINAYVDDRVGGRPVTVPPGLVEPLASTPTWVFHSEEDDKLPDPLRKRLAASVDDSEGLVAALHATGNAHVKYTRYELGRLPPNYITGHAAFEFAFNEPTIWPWLEAQRLHPAKALSIYAVTPASAGLAALGVVLLYALLRVLRAAWAVSSLALLASSVAFLGLMQSEGGLLDSCYSYSFFDIGVEQCRAIGAEIVKAGAAEQGWFALAVSKARAENCFALGHGVGALFAVAEHRSNRRACWDTQRRSDGRSFAACLPSSSPSRRARGKSRSFT
jgi:dienelactone hydrolase